MRCRFGLLAVALVLCQGHLALAQSGGPSAEDIRAAGESFDLGKRAYKDSAWVEAAEQFEAADARAPSAVALDLAIRARDKAKQLDRAATLAALALERHDDKALTKNAKALIARAEKTLHKVVVRCEPECELVIGTKLVHGGATKQRTLFLSPGGVAVHASWSESRTRSAPVKAVAGGSGELNFEAPPEPSSEKPADPRPTDPGSGSPPARPGPNQPPEQDRPEQAGGLSPVIFWIGAGATAVVGGITVWSGIDTLENPGKDAVRSACAGQGTDCPEYQDGLSKQRRTNVLLGVTAGLAVTTGVIGAFFTDWSSKEPKQKATRLEPFIGVGDGATLGARGVF